MDFLLFLSISAIILLATFLFAVILPNSKNKNIERITPLKVLSAGVFLSVFLLIFPVNYISLTKIGCNIYAVALETVFNSVKVFAMGMSVEFVASGISSVSDTVFDLYIAMTTFLFFFAPVISLGWILSLLKNISSKIKYRIKYNSEVYAFSELNEKSLSLARNLYKNSPKQRVVVFANMPARDDIDCSWLEILKDIKAICFRKDIITVDFSFHNKNKNISLFAISEDESKNISDAFEFIERFYNRDNTNIYLFSTDKAGELMLSGKLTALDENNPKTERKIKVRRINEVQSFINRNLYDNGFETVYKNAVADENGLKHIGALVLGMGNYGFEMARALPWFCQMDGYKASVYVFDAKKDAKDIFLSRCPELVEYSDNDINGESKYSFSIYSGIDINTASFDSIVNNLPFVTYIFVSLGSDELNVSAAVKLRTLCQRYGFDPKIQAVIWNKEKKEALNGVSNYKGQKYNIDFVGDIETVYSESVILKSDLEKKALQRHLKWGSEREFWQFEYNYRSSVASAIHQKIKKQCGIPGAEKSSGDRSKEELNALRELEHRRWNAFLRSEGYVYGGTTERSGRNDMAKTHNCLVPFGELSEDEKRKDDD